MRKKLVVLSLAAGALMGAAGPAFAYDFWCYKDAKQCGPGSSKCRSECYRRTSDQRFCFNRGGVKGEVDCES